MSRFITSLTISLTTTISLCVSAFGIDRDVTISTLRRDSNAQSRIQLLGRLNCLQAEINTGESCALSIQDQMSGKTYQLHMASAAMDLYQKGTRLVRLEGKLMSASDIEVWKVIRD